MILLKANQELRNTFEKLIETMKAPVQWTGIFAVVDDYMILQGQVRSLFFHFDTKKVVTNIIDIPVKEDEVWEILNNARVRNTINMILYAFGKWGNISGIRVDKDYAQLNRLFSEIMKEIGVTVEYTQNHFRFFKQGIRITYEDVIQAALEEPELLPEPEAEEEQSGLWHSMIWKRKEAVFPHVDTTLAERLKGRLGNNFYQIGYLCPVCKNKLYMVVYPMDREFRIETEEGGVLLARACACDTCNCFYTPRPQRLLAEGDVYFLPFGEDKKAYEDYLELIGRTGERVSNNHFNEYADRRGKNRTPEDTLEELADKMENLSAEELEEIEARLDEVFFPDESTKKYEKKVREETHKKQKEREKRRKQKENNGKDVNRQERADKREKENPGKKRQADAEESRQEEKTWGQGGVRNLRSSGIKIGEEGLADEEERTKEAALSQNPAVRSRYEAKLGVMERFSERQLGELEKQIANDRELLTEEKEQYLGEIKKKRQQAKKVYYQQKVEECEKKPYAVTKKVETQLRQEEYLPPEEKNTLLKKIAGFLKRQGEEEVRQMMEQMPADMDKARYRNFMQKLKAYEEVDFAPYQEKIMESARHAEGEELAKLVKDAPKRTRGDYARLAELLRQGDYTRELVEPYLEKIEGKLADFDKDAIAAIVDEAAGKGFEEEKKAYDAIADGEFLPELKTDALKMLEKRLSKIKTDESELLVQKLQTACREAGIAENDRHHFYPARKVLMGQAAKEETQVIDYALASYAGTRGLFEYPILVVDTSRNKSGKEGVIITPEHIYYSTFLNAYGINIASVSQVTASTGLLNRGLYIHQGNGQKIKIPYAVENKELSAFAEVLDEFIRYLKEKPDSRNVTYLAKKKHEKICCFRCGTFYQGGSICPKCGYKNNG